MTVYCLIPVHNNLPKTEAVLHCLRAQDFKDCRTVVVDDGSTDGTAELISHDFPEVTLLQGNGSLWWTGAMAKGLAYILPRAKDGDFVLFQNNDTQFMPNYVTTLVSVSQAYGNAVVGSILKDITNPERILSFGPRIHYFKALIKEAFVPADVENGASSFLPEVLEMDALSGRGTLYPISVLRRIGTVRCRWLPHYLADYEIAARAKAAGVKMLVSTSAVVRTGAENSGIDMDSASWVEKLFSRRSRSNILDSIAFFSLAGPWYLRITAPLRVVFFWVWRTLRALLAV